MLPDPSFSGDDTTEEDEFLELIDPENHPGMGKSNVWELSGWCTPWVYDGVALNYVWTFEGLRRTKKSDTWDEAVASGECIVCQVRLCPRDLIYI